MALPKIEPVLPTLSRVVPLGRDWLYEAKLDGFRGVLYIQNGHGRFFSKTKNPMHRFQDLADALARTMPLRDAIFDGEIVVMGQHGPDFDALFHNRGTPTYAAFDLLWVNGSDLRSLPLSRRKTALRRATKSSRIGFVEPMRDPRLYEAVVRMDLEGIVAKRRGDLYASGTQWLKIKYPEYSQNEGRAEMFHRLRR